MWKRIGKTDGSRNPFCPFGTAYKIHTVNTNDNRLHTGPKKNNFFVCNVQSPSSSYGNDNSYRNEKKKAKKNMYIVQKLPAFNRTLPILKIYFISPSHSFKLYAIP